MQQGLDTASTPGRIPWLETSIPEFADTEFILHSTAHSLAALVHDARNMVAAMDLYCDLLEEPGVLSAPFHHYASELRLVGRASRTLLEKLATAEILRSVETASRTHNASVLTRRLPRGSGQQMEQLPESISFRPSKTGMASANSPRTLARGNYRRNFHLGRSVENLADELHANHNLLA